MPEAKKPPGRTAQFYRLVRVAGHITLAEFRQYRDFYLGLKMLNGQTDSPGARLLWAGLWLPLGIEEADAKIS